MCMDLNTKFVMVKGVNAQKIFCVRINKNNFQYHPWNCKVNSTVQTSTSNVT